MNWSENAPVLAAVFAGVGLFLNAAALCFNTWQMNRSRRNFDLQALQKFLADAIERDAALLNSKANSAHYSRAFNEFLAFVEAYCSAYNEDLFLGKGVRKIVRYKLIDCYIELDHHKEHLAPHLVKAMDRSTTMEELTKFAKQNKTEIEQRKAEKKRFVALAKDAAA